MDSLTSNKTDVWSHQPESETDGRQHCHSLDIHTSGPQLQDTAHSAGMGLPLRYPFLEMLHRPTHRCVLKLITDPIKLTIKIYYQTHELAHVWLQGARVLQGKDSRDVIQSRQGVHGASACWREERAAGCPGPYWTWFGGGKVLLRTLKVLKPRWPLLEWKVSHPACRRLMTTGCFTLRIPSVIFWYN